MAQDLCSVFLNKSPSGVFYTGDIVTGSVTFVFKKKLQILDINCRVVGKCKSSWTRPMATIPFIKKYTGKRKVFEAHIDMFDHYKGKTISPGIESQNFHFTLPDDLPSSFESSFGKVEYYFKLTRKAKFKLKEKTIVPIVIIGKVNLNHLEDFVVCICEPKGDGSLFIHLRTQTPSFHKIQKSFKFMRGNVSMYIKTYRGFASSQIIPFEVGISNEENRKISKIKVFFIQKIKYTVEAGYLEEEKQICKMEHKLNSNNEKELCKFFMEIPDVLPSSVHISEPMIEISYAFRVEVMFPLHSTCYKDIPVTVATVRVNHYDYDEAEQLFYEM